jgi:hypothetical protein
MKKHELKASLGRVRAREELVISTMAAVAKQKERSEKRFTLPSYSQGLRFAGAMCALALVFCIGFVAARQDWSRPEQSTLGQLEVAEMTMAEVAAFAFENEQNNNYVLLGGRVESIRFAELTEDDVNNDVVKKCKVTVSASKLVDISDDLSVDLNKTGTTFESDIVFYDHETMDYFFDLSIGEMILRLVPDENGNWSITDFAPDQE